MSETVLTETRNPLGYEPIGKLLKTFAWPAIISFLINSVYNIVDQMCIRDSISSSSISTCPP